MTRTADGTSAWTGFFDVRHVHPLRSTVFFAVGAACGLVIAGYGLFTARGTVTHLVPPEDVALVNQRPILRTDFIAQTEAETHKTFGEATAAERLKVLDKMVREELLVQHGLELDFPGTDPDTRNALVAAVEQQVEADVVTAVPTDAQLRKYFDDNPARYASEGSMIVHHFLLPGSARPGPEALATARKAATALRGGATAAEIVEAYGVHEVVPEHAAPEQFYFAEKVHLGDALFAQALRLDDGQVSDPIAAPDGVHILMMVRNIKPVPLQFDRVRSQVLNDYITAAKQRLEDADERYLRANADILIADDFRAAYTAGQQARP